MEKKELLERLDDRLYTFNTRRTLQPTYIIKNGAREGEVTISTDYDEMMHCDKEKLVDFIQDELDKAREEGYRKGWGDGSKGKVFEKIEVETEVRFKDLKDVIEGKEDAGEFLSKLKE